MGKKMMACVSLVPLLLFALWSVKSRRTISARNSADKYRRSLMPLKQVEQNIGKTKKDKFVRRQTEYQRAAMLIGEEILIHFKEDATNSDREYDRYMNAVNKEMEGWAERAQEAL